MSERIYQWYEVTPTLITNRYLYGFDSTPSELTSAQNVRSAMLNQHPETLGPTSIYLDSKTYMESGPGKYAFDAMTLGPSSFVAKAFFERVDLPFTGFRQVLSVEDLKLLSPDLLSVTTFLHLFKDGLSPDHGARTYIWNTVEFKIAPEARFVIEPDGRKYIENFALIPRDDDFDFVSSNPLTELGNLVLGDDVDPSMIGQRVNLIFDQTSSQNIPRIPVLTSLDYFITQTRATPGYVADLLLGLTATYSQIADIRDQLWNEGTTRFIDKDGRAIVYGTVDNDVLDPYANLRTQALLLQFMPEYRSAILNRGLAIVSGAGSDLLMGSERGDALYGGSGYDVYRFSGLFGQDEVIDSDGLGRLELNGLTLSGGKSAGKPNTWVQKLGDGSYVGYQLFQDASSSTGYRLAITRNVAEGSIIVNNFDRTAALSGAGYLGIHLDNSARIALVQGTCSNPFLSQADAAGEVAYRTRRSWVDAGSSIHRKRMRLPVTRITKCSVNLELPTTVKEGLRQR
jgi:hypothetical protein